MLPDLLHGKGIWLRRVARDPAGLSSLAGELQAAGFAHAILPAADGADPASLDAHSGHDAAAALTRLLRAAGLRVWGWHAVYGDRPRFKGPPQDGYHRAEAACALQRAARLQEAGLQGYVLVAEADYERIPGRAAKAAEFSERLRAGLPGFPIALSARKYPSDHPALPWAELRRLCDADLPPVFWPGKHGSAAQMLETSWQEFAALDPRLDYAPVGPAFTYRDWEPSPEDVDAFCTHALSLGLPGVSFWSWDDAGPDRAGRPYWQAIAAFEWTASAEAEALPLGPPDESPAAFRFHAGPDDALPPEPELDPHEGADDPLSGLELETGDVSALETDGENPRAWLPDPSEDLPAWLESFPLDEPEAETDTALADLADRLFAAAGLEASSPEGWNGGAPEPDESAAADEEAEALLTRLKAEADQASETAAEFGPQDDDPLAGAESGESDWAAEAGLALDPDGWMERLDGEAETEPETLDAGYTPGEEGLPEWLEDSALEPAASQAVHWASITPAALAGAPAPPAHAARTIGQFFKALRQGRPDLALELYAAGCVHVTGERVNGDRDRVLRFYEQQLKGLVPGTPAVLGLRGSPSAARVTWTARSLEGEVIRVEDTFHLNRAGRIVYHHTLLGAAGQREPG